MKSIKILGTGCAQCRTTIALVEAVAKEKGVEITLEKVESLPDIMSYGVMSTPAWSSTGRWCMPEACPHALRWKAGSEGLPTVGPATANMQSLSAFRRHHTDELLRTLPELVSLRFAVDA